MEYDDIITKINNLNESNFTMNDFNSLSSIIKEIRSIYQKDVLNEKLDAKAHYDAMMDQLYTVVFSVLKQKLQFEDEVISKIMYLINYSDSILDVFVLDGNVFVKVYDDKNNSVSIVPLDNSFDITSNRFNKNVVNNNFNYFLMQSFNNTISPWYSDKLGKKKLLSMKNDTITYNLANVNIFVNNSLKSIIDSSANNIPQVTKVIFRFDDELYYFDMKIRDEYLILSYNDYPVNKLSVILNSSDKAKKL